MKKLSTKPGMFLSSNTGVGLSLLPCRDSLRMHIKRANYQALIWNRAGQAVPCISQPAGHAGTQNMKHWSSKWTEGELLPQEIV